MTLSGEAPEIACHARTHTHTHTPCSGHARPRRRLHLKERPPAPSSWGYRPAPAATVTVNPPAFVWSPERDAAAYSLQIARDDAFTDLVYEEKESRWSSYVPYQPLAPGTYHWRYRALKASGSTSNWSSTRTFTLEDNTAEFPKPTLRQLRARISKEHPRLFFRPEDVPELQAQGRGALQGYWETTLKQADAILAKLPDTSEPPKYPEGTQRKGEVWKKIWWGNRVHAIRVAEGAAKLAFAWRLTGEERYGARARDLLMASMAWDPKGATQYDYNDEAAMPLLYWPSRAYTWAYDYLSDEERAKVVEVMTVRGEDCFNHLRRRQHLWNPYASHSNRAWHFLGEVGITFHDTIPAAPTWLDYAVTIFYTCYPVWGGSDGGWHEGTAYWASYMDRFMWWAMVSHSALNINVFNKPFFSQTGYYALYTTPPNAKRGAFGDQAIKAGADRNRLLMAMLAASARNEHWQWYADTVGNVLMDRGWLGFLFANQAQGVTPTPPTDLPGSRAFMGTGLVAMNTNLLDANQNIQVHMKSSPFGRVSHGYNAQNSFLLHVNNTPVFTRSGVRDIHGSPHHQQWMWETKSDNAILVNGEGQYKHSPKALGKITHFETHPTHDIAIGEAGDAYEHLDRWTRRIFFLKPDYVVIHDLLQAPEPSTYTWMLHGPSPFTINGNTLTVPQAQVQIYTPEALTITQTNEYDTPLHDWFKNKPEEWHLSATTPNKAATNEFFTLIRIGDAPEAAYTQAEATHTLKLPNGLTLSSGPDTFTINQSK